MRRHFVSAGIFGLDPKGLRLIPEGSYDMPDLFKQFAVKNMEVTLSPIRECWLNIGRMDDLESAKDDYEGIFE